MKVRKEIKIEEETLKGLAKLAEEDRRNLSNFIEKILTDYVERSKK